MWNDRMIRALALFSAMALGAAVAGCTRAPEIGGDPKARLTEYIQGSFNVKGISDRQRLLGILSGDARTRLAAWSDDQFREAFMSARRELLKISFKEVKPINPAEVSVTYEVVYTDKGRANSSGPAKVTNKKLAQMVRGADGGWTIADVHNIKELIEYSNEMSLP